MSRPQAESHPQTTQMVLDVMVLAHGGLTWEREFSDTRFERLVDVALSDMPQVKVRLKFATLDKRPVIHGELQAAVELRCQRCMNSMQYPVRETFELMLVETEAELALVPESYEPWIANAQRLNVLELIEEQLLLALPLIAKHADQRECVDLGESLPVTAELSAQPSATTKAAAATDGEAMTEVQRPFGNLRDLLGKQ